MSSMKTNTYHFCFGFSKIKSLGSIVGNDFAILFLPNSEILYFSEKCKTDGCYLSGNTSSCGLPISTMSRQKLAKISEQVCGKDRRIHPTIKGGGNVASYVICKRRQILKYKK